MSRQPCVGLTTSVLVLFACALASEAQAVGVLYGDPGWFYAYEGDEAFYNDPDGPHPDPINGTDNNEPGGQGGTAALVDTGDDPALWFHQSSNWDGSAPGDPLGGTPGDPPPIPPAAPGGVGAFVDGDDGSTFLRIQDTGQPQNWGWPDKGVQAAPGAPKQEGNNRKIQFAHDMDVDDLFSGDQAILDNGITLTFRTRLATGDTGPIDAIHVEGGPSASPGGAPVPWPADGLGYEVSNQGRGMFHLTQSSPTGGEQQMAFSLVDMDTITFESLGITKVGLVMNNQANPSAANDVDTNEATDNSLNVVEIPDEDLDDWHEFWITIVKEDGLENGTHKVQVWTNGASLEEEAETFDIVLAPENEFGAGAHLGLGLSSGSRQGAFDVDFYAYMEGVVPPILAPPGTDADGNGSVDGKDFLIIQGETPLLIPDWEQDYGTVSVASAVPEPGSMSLLALALLTATIRRRTN